MEKIIIKREEMENISPLLKGIMELAFDESCIMDKSGYIIHCSESSPLIWGRPNSESIGHHIAELDSASPYPELLATGKPVLGKLHIINGMTCITHMIPLFDEQEEIIGAFGVIPKRQASLCQNQLYRHPPHTAGVGALWLREGRFFRGIYDKARQIRDRRQRHHSAGRDRRSGCIHAEQASQSNRGKGI